MSEVARWGKLRGRRVFDYKGYLRKMWRMVRGELQCEQIGAVCSVNRWEWTEEWCQLFAYTEKEGMPKERVLVNREVRGCGNVDYFRYQLS